MWQIIRVMTFLMRYRILIWLYYALLCMVEQFRGRYWIMHPAMIFRGQKVVVVITGKDLSTDAQIGMVMEEVKGTDDINGIKTDRADDDFARQFLSMITE